MTLNNIDDKLMNELISFRRDLHQNPELGFFEFRTAGKIIKKLNELNINYEYGNKLLNKDNLMGYPTKETLDTYYQSEFIQSALNEIPEIELFKNESTAILAEINFSQDGPTTLLRVDMDALPIHETEIKNHVPNIEGYRSKVKGVMHACGHDIHTTLGVGILKYLGENKKNLKGTLKVLFQPAEEGVRGAKSLTNETVLGDLDYFIASHVGLEKKSGELLVSEEGFMASSKFDLTFKGESSHAGSHPDLGKNALLAACQFVSNFYSISRSHLGDTRVNVGTIKAGSGRNIIADKAFLQLETRGASTEANNYIVEQMIKLTKGIEVMYDVVVEVDKQGEAETSYGTDKLKDIVFELAKNYYGEHAVQKESHHPSGSEDATFLMNYVKERGGEVLYMNYGTNLAASHHNPKFDVEENDLFIFTDFMIEVINELHK